MGKRLLKPTEFLRRLKIDRKNFWLFFAANVAAFVAGKVFSPVNASSEPNAFMTLLSIFKNVFYMGYTNKAIVELKQKVPIPYQYLPAKYQKISYINAWIPISIISLLVFAWFKRIASIIVIIFYWLIDLFITLYEIEEEKEQAFTYDQDRLIDIYSQLQNREKIENLAQLLREASEVEEERNYRLIMDLSCEFFRCCLEDEIKAIKIGNEFDYMKTRRGDIVRSASSII